MHCFQLGLNLVPKTTLTHPRSVLVGPVCCALCVCVWCVMWWGRFRNRECEASITLEYLTNLHKAYEDFIQEISRVIPVIRVNWSRFRTAEVL